MAPASRNPEEIMEFVRPLLTLLEEARSLEFMKMYVPASKPTSSSVTDKLLESIHGEVHFINDIFFQLEIWERDMKDKIGDIVKQLNSALQDSNSQGELQSKLEILNKDVSGFKESMMKLERLEEHVKSVSSVPLNVSSVPLNSPHLSGPSPSTRELHQFDSNKSVAEVEVNIKNLSPLFQSMLVFFLNFPVGTLIKKRTLIYWWMGERQPYHVVSEFAAETNLRDLVRGNYIKCTYRAYKPWDVDYIDSCRIDSSTYEVLINLAQQEGYFNSIATQLACDPVSGRSCLQSALEPNQEIVLQSYHDLRFQRCFNVNNKYLKFEKNKFMEMRNFCAMMLGRWQSSAKHHIEVENTKFLNWLGSFKNLNYLSLRGISRIVELPPSIGELTNLRILDLQACHNLESLPVELTKLPNLVHLDTSDCFLLDHMPKGLGSLPLLRVLKGFVVGSSRWHDPCQLSELSKLYKLTKLSISIGRYSVLKEGEFNELCKLKFLVSLTITWPVPSKLALMVTEKDVSPPPNLEKLDLRCIPHNTAPRWLSPSKLKKLRRLYIRGGYLKLHSFCAAIQTWPALKVLRVRFLQEVDMEEAELRNVFPNLEYLEV